MTEFLRGKRSGFTLIELLVVISIIAILASMLLPALRTSRETAKKAVCISNIRQIVMGLLMYWQDYNNIPPTDWGGPVSYERWAEYVMVTNGGQTWCALGILYHDRYITNKEVLWCPSTKDPFINGKSKAENLGYLDVLGSKTSDGPYYYRLRTGYASAPSGEVISPARYGNLFAVGDMFLYPVEEPTRPEVAIHNGGFNAAYWDGSAKWISNTDHSYSQISAGNQSFIWLADQRY